MSTKCTPKPDRMAREPRVHDLISAERIAERVGELGSHISADYAGRELTVIGVLHGAFMFLADLVRHITVPVRCGFVTISSYGHKTESSGRIRLHADVTEPLGGRDVLLVDDIVDTGLSTAWLIEHCEKKGPASLRVCTLLDKKARRSVAVKVDYVGFEIPDRFVVGYGIDWSGRFRELPYVGYVEDGGPG
jgi:hypoxanthine phosphoribosyltransferase